MIDSNIKSEIQEKLARNKHLTEERNKQIDENRAYCRIWSRYLVGFTERGEI